LILALTLLFLELEGDTADGTTLDTLHQMCGVSGDLVPETLGGDDCDLEEALVACPAPYPICASSPHRKSSCWSRSRATTWGSNAQ
jgi:hypothetical protein